MLDTTIMSPERLVVDLVVVDAVTLTAIGYICTLQFTYLGMISYSMYDPSQYMPLACSHIQEKLPQSRHRTQWFIVRSLDIRNCLLKITSHYIHATKRSHLVIKQAECLSIFQSTVSALGLSSLPCDAGRM